ncbi:MAG: diadenylate cyclase CdaA [Tidjanibacter sp.]|nr:diadenylate cyclase CdaA [Tidjanibacter sp.]
MGFIKMSIIDVVDILIVALIMYYIYKLIRGTQATSILAGILVIYVAWIVARAFNMELMSGILGSVVNVGLIALIIIFQSEIRKFLQTLGTNSQQSGPLALILKLIDPSRRTKHEDISAIIDPIVRACGDMSTTYTGALIVIKQDGSLDDIIATGVTIDANIDSSLIRNIFFKNSPLHDGAMVISGGRITAAKCVLPSTKSEVPLSFGMRHRAAMGLCEESDAIVVVVSEETGAISVAQNGKIKRGLSEIELRAELMRLGRVAEEKAAKEEREQLLVAENAQKDPAEGVEAEGEGVEPAKVEELQNEAKNGQ